MLNLCRIFFLEKNVGNHANIPREYMGNDCISYINNIQNIQMAGLVSTAVLA